MWADNEADVDLLGFDFLVDSLYVAVTEPRLLPLTVGLLGDWGSGKSSLMAITRSELERPEGDGTDPSPYLCVSFSPWQYEGYNDVKVALITTMLDAIASRVEVDDEPIQEKISLLRRAARRFGNLGRKVGRTGLLVLPTAAPLVARAIDPTMEQDTIDSLTAVAETLSGAGGERFQDPEPDGQQPPPREPELVPDAGEFRTQFEALVGQLRGVEAIVVFVDDLDRCLPDTVVDTFEAIRLFVNTSKTAYVIAANQAVVESAIDSRYPELVKDGVGLGANYLEKMLQVKVTIPHLSAPEADTYMNLLLAELRLDEEQFEQVLAETQKRRQTGNIQVAFNLGVCADVLQTVPTELTRDLQWAASVSEVLGSGLRGNPRQLKRFLNKLMLKHRSAKRRNIELELPVLAKLLALEEQYVTEFRKLYHWQLDSAGPIPQLRAAEEAVSTLGVEIEPEIPAERAGSHASPAASRKANGKKDVAPDAKPMRLSEEVQNWISKPHIQTWLKLSPRLGETDLRSYFTYSRDKLTLGVSVTLLPQHLQELLAQVQIGVEATRLAACDAIAKLDEGERSQLTEVLLEALVRNPSGTAFVAAVDLAERASDTLEAVCEALLRVPPNAVPIAGATRAVRRFGSKPAAAAVLDRWENSDVANLKAVVSGAREARKRSGRA